MDYSAKRQYLPIFADNLLSYNIYVREKIIDGKKNQKRNVSSSFFFLIFFSFLNGVNSNMVIEAIYTSQLSGLFQLSNDSHIRNNGKKTKSTKYIIY